MPGSAAGKSGGERFELLRTGVFRDLDSLCDSPGSRYSVEPGGRDASSRAIACRTPFALTAMVS